MSFLKRASQLNDEMPFLDHLEELRIRIFRSLVALFIGVGVGFWVVTHFEVLELLIAPVRTVIGTGEKLKYLSPADPFFITLKLAVLVGLLLALPVVVYQLWAFLAPALTKRERRVIVPTMYLGLVLFLGGVAMAYFLALPMTLKFMMGFQTASLEESIVITNYTAFVVKLLLAFGVVFELPVVILVLSLLGVVDAPMLASKRRHAIVAITVLAAILTPGDVIVLTLFMMIPLVLLYEMSIGLAKMVDRRRAAELAADAAEAEARAGAL